MSATPATTVHVGLMGPEEATVILPCLIMLLIRVVGPSVWFSEITHEDGCRCRQGDNDLRRCSCSYVDIRIRRLEEVE